MPSRKGKTYTKSQLASDLADKAGITKASVSQVLGALEDIAISHLKSDGSFTIPGIVKLVVKHKKATPAQTKNIFGKETRVSAKPSRRVVRGRILKSIKDAI